MSCFMMSDGSLFFRSDDLGLSLKSTYDSVHGIKEILLVDRTLVVARSSQGRLVAYIGNIRS